MVDPGNKCNLGWFKGIIRGEMDIEGEDAIGVGGVVGAEDGGVPVEDVIAEGSSGAVGGGVFDEFGEFFLDSFECHGFLKYF